MKQVLPSIFSLFLGLILFSGCAKKDNVTLLEDASDVADNQIEQYIRSHNIDAIRDATGLYFQILDPGDSIHYMLSLDNIPTIMYTRRLLDDKQIDASLSPTNFNNRKLKDHIAGWQIGLQKIAKGGKILLIIPPTLGFGNVAVDDKIPANSVLVCELTLVDFK
ncbi:MAG TPA: FKBP-type peptidyl-prolyl cis-trans isomerase [Chitinophaga sp.]